MKFGSYEDITSLPTSNTTLHLENTNVDQLPCGFEIVNYAIELPIRERVARIFLKQT